jgi:hypothetical protein
VANFWPASPATPDSQIEKGLSQARNREHDSIGFGSPGFLQEHRHFGSAREAGAAICTEQNAPPSKFEDLATH